MWHGALLGELHELKAFAYASLAMRRELQLRQASGDASVGHWGAW